jgi:hypothetical protein
MKHLSLFLALAAVPALAQPAPGPVTLTAQEMSVIMQALVQRDPVLATLIAAQERARQAAQKPEPAPTDKP